jgi:hypothetical protein
MNAAPEMDVVGVTNMPDPRPEGREALYNGMREVLANGIYVDRHTNGTCRMMGIYLDSRGFELDREDTWDVETGEYCCSLRFTVANGHALCLAPEGTNQEVTMMPDDVLFTHLPGMLTALFLRAKDAGFFTYYVPAAPATEAANA